jgi:hypothetical protein
MKSSILLGVFAISPADSSIIGKSLSVVQTNTALTRHLQFDQLGGCPESCSSPEICDFYETQASGGDLDVSSESLVVLEDACNAGTLQECAPSILSGACGLCGGGLLSSFVSAEEVEMICSACEFLDCCDGGEGFDTCAESLPEELLVDDTASASTEAAEETTDMSASTTATTEAATEATITEAAVETTESTSTEAAVDSTRPPTPSPIEEDESLAPTPSPLLQQDDDNNDDLIQSGPDDDFLGGFFGGVPSSGEGLGEIFDSIGDFVGGLFGEGDVNFTLDDGFDGAFNESADDVLEEILGGGFESGSQGGILGGIGEFIEGLFGEGPDAGDLNFTSGAFNEFDDDIVGEISQGGIGDVLDGLLGAVFDGTSMLGSSMACSEDSTCPVEGFCDCMSGDLSKCSLSLFGDVCSSGSVFSCAPANFKELCDAQCPPQTRQLQDGQGPAATAESNVAVQSETESYESANCMMCQVARCCESEGSTMTQCAMEVGMGPQAISNLTDMGEVVSDFVNDVMENITEMVDAFISNITLPEFCPNGSCPIDGFCECFQGDFIQCNEQVMRDACTNNALFGECGPADLKEFCTNECNGSMESIQDMVNMAMCSMCSIAACCEEQGSPETCIFGSTSYNENTAVELVSETSDKTESKNEAVDEETTEKSQDEIDLVESKDAVAFASAEDDVSSGAQKLHYTMVYLGALSSCLFYMV